MIAPTSHSGTALEATGNPGYNMTNYVTLASTYVTTSHSPSHLGIQLSSLRPIHGDHAGVRVVSILPVGNLGGRRAVCLLPILDHKG